MFGNKTIENRSEFQHLSTKTPKFLSRLSDHKRNMEIALQTHNGTNVISDTYFSKQMVSETNIIIHYVTAKVKLSLFFN
jgi:hypothetical protein